MVIKFVLFPSLSSLNEYIIHPAPGDTIGMIKKQLLSDSALTIKEKELETAFCQVDGLYADNTYELDGTEKEISFTYQLLNGC